MTTEFKVLLCCAWLLSPFFLCAQCPSELNNTNGNGEMTLFWDSSTPPNLNMVDVDFTDITGNNFSVNLLPGDVYQTSSNVFANKTLTGEMTLRYADNSTLSCNYITGSFINPLPVELTKFEGVLKNKDIILNWSTANELNNAGFEIEYSFDGERFEVIGTVNGMGTTELAQDYEFIDLGVKIRALNNSAYYRLVQIDFDGTKTYSEILVIDLGLDFEDFEITKITGWDSTDDKIQVFFYAPYGIRKVNYLVADLNGRIVKRGSIFTTQQDFNTFEVDLTGTKSAIYFLSLDNGKEIIGEKIAIGSKF